MTFSITAPAHPHATRVAVYHCPIIYTISGNRIILGPKSFVSTELVVRRKNKAGYTATLVACGWAGAVIEKVTGAFGQEQ